MGIDYLDIFFRLEKTFDLKLHHRDTPWANSPGITDLTAGELADWVNQVRQRTFAAPTRRIKRPFACPGCKRDMHGVPTPGFCRWCGRAIDDEQYVWRCVVQILIDALGVDYDQVHRNARLIKDLGMT